MVKLTLAGKIVILAISLLLLYFFVLPSILNIIPNDNVKRTREIKVVAFLKTFDSDSAKLQEILRKIGEDENLSKIAKITIVNVEAEPGKMGQNNISEEEVPCFILGSEKFTGFYSLEWFKQRITALAETTKETA
ncbi:MAG: hypothetical protein QXK06_04425 [Candidatus Diapherotrites archaeon]